MKVWTAYVGVIFCCCAGIAPYAAEPWRKVAKSDAWFIGYGLGKAMATSARCERYVTLGGDIGPTLDLFSELGVESVYLDGFNNGVAVIGRDTFERVCDKERIHRMVAAMYSFHPKFKELVLCRKADQSPDYVVCPPAVSLPKH